MFSLICAWINGWVNNREASDLRRHGAPWWRHQMESFSALLAHCEGTHPSPVNSPHNGQCRWALMLSLTCTRINGWVNNRVAGNLGPHRAHYDVNVMPYDASAVMGCWWLGWYDGHPQPSWWAKPVGARHTCGNVTLPGSLIRHFSINDVTNYQQLNYCLFNSLH